MIIVTFTGIPQKIMNINLSLKLLLTFYSTISFKPLSYIVARSDDFPTLPAWRNVSNSILTFFIPHMNHRFLVKS